METSKNTDKAIVVHLGFGPELPGASHLLRLMLASFCKIDVMVLLGVCYF